VIAVSYFLKFSLYYNKIPSKVISLTLHVHTIKLGPPCISNTKEILLTFDFPLTLKQSSKTTLSLTHSKNWKWISTNDKNISQTLHTFMPHQSSHPLPAFKESQNFDRPTPHKRRNSKLTIWAFSSLCLHSNNTSFYYTYNFEACNQNFKESQNPETKMEEENTSTQIDHHFWFPRGNKRIQNLQTETDA
jgi:hypothetical protein